MKRLGTALEFGAKDRALPADPEELGKPVAVMSGRDRTRGLSTSQALGCALLPVDEHIEQLPAKRLRKCAHLLAEIAYQTASRITEALHGIRSIVSKPPKPFERGLLLVQEKAVELPCKIGSVAVDQLPSKCFFARKVVVERTLRHVDATQDFVDPRRGIALTCP